MLSNQLTTGENITSSAQVITVLEGSGVTISDLTEEFTVRYCRATRASISCLFSSLSGSRIHTHCGGNLSLRLLLFSALYYKTVSESEDNPSHPLMFATRWDKGSCTVRLFVFSGYPLISHRGLVRNVSSGWITKSLHAAFLHKNKLNA